MLAEVIQRAIHGIPARVSVDCAGVSRRERTCFVVSCNDGQTRISSPMLDLVVTRGLSFGCERCRFSLVCACTCLVMCMALDSSVGFNVMF